MCMCISPWQGPNVCNLEEVSSHLPQGEDSDCEKKNLIEEIKITQQRKDPTRSFCRLVQQLHFSYLHSARIKVESSVATKHNTKHNFLDCLLIISCLYTLHHVAHFGQYLVNDRIFIAAGD